MITHEGENLIFLVTKGPVLDDAGHVVGLFGISRDITQSKQVEEEIRTGRMKLEAALGSMSDAVFISDNQGRFIHFNEAFAKFHKFNGKEECATSFHEYPALLDVSSIDGKLLTPVTPDQWAMPRALRGETATNVEFNLRRKDSGTSWIGSYNFAPIRDDEGIIIGAVVTSRDITERKQTEQALQRLTQELEQRVAEQTKEVFDLYNQAPCGYHSLAMDGSILRVNQTELSLLGYTSEDYVGHHISEFIASDSVERFHLVFPEFIRTGRIRDIEMNFICKDGSIRAFLVSGDLIRDEQGRGLYTNSTMLDNSERKAREQKILDLNKFLSEVLEMLPFGVVVYDENDKAILRNSLFGKILNYPSEFSQKEPLFFSESIRFNFDRGDYPDRPFEEILAGFVTLMESRQSVCFERKQTNGAYLEIRGQPISNGWILLTYTDITQQ